MNVSLSRPRAPGLIALLTAAFALFNMSQASAKSSHDASPRKHFSVESLNGFYAFASISEDTKAVYGMVQFDGAGNVHTDDIALNVSQEGGGRAIVHLGAGNGIYTMDDSGLGDLVINFENEDTQGRSRYEYQFVITEATPQNGRRALLALAAFAASSTTGSANSSVTYVSPINARRPALGMKFDLASLKGDFAYFNNAEEYASHAVYTFDGAGNVYSPGVWHNAPDPDRPGERIIRFYGPFVGTYQIDSSGLGLFAGTFGNLPPDRTYTYDFVVTSAAPVLSRGRLRVDSLFSAGRLAGLFDQLFAPTLTRQLKR